MKQNKYLEAGDNGLFQGQALSRHLPGDTEETYEMLKIRWDW
jgi:hypothetical protein